MSEASENVDLASGLAPKLSSCICSAFRPVKQNIAQLRIVVRVTISTISLSGHSNNRLQ